MDERINIGAEAAALVAKLGLDYDFVRELVLTPSTATATVYIKNASGKKHIDRTTGELAIEVCKFKVRT